MKVPSITGTIVRRLLVNFRVDPAALQPLLPAPFSPLLLDGWAIAGICLIRLEGIKPEVLCLPIGLGSENAAHRVAVQWEAAGTSRQGVFIPRRDTNSKLNAWAGGRLFPGTHHLADFQVSDTDELSIRYQSRDKSAQVEVRGRQSSAWPKESVFKCLLSASDFFRKGSCGYSPTERDDLLDGIELDCPNWEANAFEAEEVYSSFFEDRSVFPKGSVHYDCSLIMRNLQHRWKSLPEPGQAEKI